MYTIPSALKSEIKELGSLISEYRSGELDPVIFKGIRVPMGIYEQREDDTYMVRVRCVGGFITPTQLKQVAHIAKKYQSEFIHITTRQEIQLQYISLEDTPKVQEELYQIGLSSRGGGGNTVRNIMASVDSGISKEEVFDVLPYATALTNKLIAESDSWTLPRKFKVAFSSSDADSAFTIFNDLGFIAKERNGEKGFKVFLGGSLSNKPMLGLGLFDFVPANDLLYVADAAKKLFSRYGNRRNKHKARLRFIFYKHGKEKVFNYFHEIYNEMKKSTNLELNIEQVQFNQVDPSLTPIKINSTEFEKWQNRYVSEQNQRSLFTIEIPVYDGNIEPSKLKETAEFIENFGVDSIRFSMRQNIHLRNIPEQYLGNIYQFLVEKGFEANSANIINSMVSCTGADTCRLGVCLTKGALKSMKSALDNSDINLEDIKDVRINLSGCPNTCGQHTSADLGFYGKVGRNDRIYPAYNILAGARIGDNIARLAEQVDEISARDLPQFTVEILMLYAAKKDKYKSFAEYFDKEGKNDMIEVCNNYRNIPDFEHDKNYYFDWGADQIFSVAGRGKGECSAGLFDMIDVDFNNIKKYKEDLISSTEVNEINDLLFQIVFSASRMLLITSGFEPKSIREVYNGFIEKFINSELIDEKYLAILKSARDNANIEFFSQKDLIIELSNAVIELYEGMDDSLQFNIPEKDKSEKPQGNEIDFALKKDYRGVACPMNFVKTKIDLAMLKSGDILEVLLDDGEPIDNVAGSVKDEGHKIIRQTQTDNYWSVVIEKR